MTTQTRAAAVCEAVLGVNAPIAVLAAAVRELPAFEAAFAYARISELMAEEAENQESDAFTASAREVCHICGEAVCDPVGDWQEDVQEFTCRECMNDFDGGSDEWSYSLYLTTGDGKVF
jgi:hypothetical protein